MGEEAKNELTKLVLGKKVFLKVNFVEKDRERLIADVYTVSVNVQEKMLEKGLATLRGGVEQKALSSASFNAREKLVGVYSEKCTQTVNSLGEDCDIKANIRLGVKSYRYPGCKQYENTLVQLHLGEKWFCNEKEALNEGFSRGSDCK